jgi:hypothetical protein
VLFHFFVLAKKQSRGTGVKPNVFVMLCNPNQDEVEKCGLVLQVCGHMSVYFVFRGTYVQFATPGFLNIPGFPYTKL